MASAPVLVIAPNPAIDRLLEVDALVPGINRPNRVTARPGGKGLNVARALVTLGGRARVVGVFGGSAGSWMRRELEARNIGVTGTTVKAEARVCTSILVRDGTLTELYESGSRVPPASWQQFRDAVDQALASRPPLAVVSGSLPPETDPAWIGDVCHAAAASGVPLVVDVTGPALDAAIAARPWMIKVNAREAETVLGRAGEEANWHATVARLASRTMVGAIVTLGSDGAIGAHAGRAWRVGTAPGGPYQTGCGDAFLAGFAVGWMRDEDWPSACRLAAGSAAASSCQPGAGELDGPLAGRLATQIDVAEEEHEIGARPQ
jgi:1-phosphofructokinase family hexose kinase